MHVITVDYRGGAPRGGTWPGGRATLQGNYPRGVRARKTADDARYIYISYTLLAELHLFEQVKTTLLAFALVEILAEQYRVICHETRIYKTDIRRTGSKTENKCEAEIRIQRSNSYCTRLHRSLDID